MKRDIDLARQLLFDIESRGPDCSLTALRQGSLPADYVRERTTTEPNDRIRYHLRQLIDAGLVKEIDRTNAGVPCVRLTHAGHELVELSRCETRWQDAKACVFDATGGISLAAVQTMLTKWAVEGAARADRYGHYANTVYGRRAYRAYETRAPYYHRTQPRRRYEAYRVDYREPLLRDSVLDAEPVEARYVDPRYYAPRYETPVYNDGRTDDLRYASDELRLLRTRPDYRERYDVDRDYSYGSRAYATARYDYPTETIDAANGVTLPIYLV